MSKPSVLLFLALCLSACNNFGTSIQAGNKTTVVFAPNGVIVDLSAGVVYLMRSPGQNQFEVEALKVKTGASLWHTAEAQKPLWVTADRLLAQRGDNSLVLLSTKDGALVPGCTLDPALLMPPIADELGDEKRLSVTESEGKIYLSWRHVDHVVQGIMRAPDEPPPAPRSDRSAVFVVEPAGCKAYVGKWPTLTASSARTKRVVSGEGKSKIVIQTASGEQELPSKEADPAVVIESTKYVVIGRQGEAQDVIRAGGYKWEIFSLDDGKIVDMLDSEFPLLVGGLFLSIERGKLRVVEIGSQEEQWSTTLRQTEYDGPLPP